MSEEDLSSSHEVEIVKLTIRLVESGDFGFSPGINVVGLLVVGLFDSATKGSSPEMG